ncbi:MAG: V-type ATP synthase subunit E, partial [Treponemataceae bacterium]|nr:V-type ATP synthase subunit E [Treponemataceae bacterium]
DLTELLNETDLKAVVSNLPAAVKAELATGLTLKSNYAIGGGFHVGLKDGAAYYDYSAEAVADLFSAYLNPRVAAILKGAVQE